VLFIAQNGANEKALCQKYWELMNQASRISISFEICDSLEKALDLKPVYQTLEHVWRELTCPKDRTSVNTAYCRLVSAIKGKTTLNVLYYYSTDDRVPKFRDELVEMLSSRLAFRYEELIAPAERALLLIKEFVTPEQWEILALRFGFSPHVRPHTIEEVTIKLGIKTRALARELLSRALRNLRRSELAIQLWEPFFQR
jgi:hypothetical protein